MAYKGKYQNSPNWWDSSNTDGSSGGFMLNQAPTVAVTPTIPPAYVNTYTDQYGSPGYQTGGDLANTLSQYGMGAAPAGDSNGGLMSSFLQQRDGSGGYGQVGLGMLQGLGNLYLGMQQYKLAKDSLNFQKDSFNKDYAARVKNYNSSIEDRQAARVSANPNAYTSVGDYMKQNRLS